MKEEIPLGEYQTLNGYTEDNDDLQEIISLNSGFFKSEIETLDRTKRKDFIKKFFPDATISDWNSWQWQLSNSITSTEKLAEMIGKNALGNGTSMTSNCSLPLRITPYYVSVLAESANIHELAKSVVPTNNELIVSSCEAHDPLGEDKHSPLPGLVHRYPDRVLFLTTSFCSTYCRYCTRSRIVGKNECVQIDLNRIDNIIKYITEHTEIRDVLLSGGDPLTLTDDILEYIISRVRSIKHVEIIRIGSKVPAVLPQRITPRLVNMLKKYHPIWMSLHFIHPDELTPETVKACTRLANAGIPLGSQTVLLKGINDNVSTMKSLFHKLMMARVRPYYIYQCDQITGSAHFRTKVEKGLEIIKGLRGHTSGYAVPTYVIDAPNGGGKIPLQPDYFKGIIDGKAVLKNFEGNEYFYINEE